jgi:hypothetical protein
MTIPSGAFSVVGLGTAMNSDDLERASNIHLDGLTWVNNYCTFAGGVLFWGRGDAGWFFLGGKILLQNKRI